MGMKTIIIPLILATSMSSFAGLFTSKPLCRDLHIGESYLVKNETATTYTANYTLRRNSILQYEAFVNIKFSYKWRVEKPREFNSKEKVRQRVTSCFNKYQNALKDEYGREIKLTLWDKSMKGIKKPKSNKVKLVSKGLRSTSSDWSLDLKCFTIVHETLHLLGLADEYSEAISGDAKSSDLYECRAIGRSDSLMGGVIEDTESSALYPGHIYSLIYPGCKEKNKLYLSCVQNAKRSNNCVEMDNRCYDSSWVLN